VSVGGAGNRITFDKVNSRLTVPGINNTVTYKGGNPKVDNIGPGSTVSKG
jgi:hypothetical protein